MYEKELFDYLIANDKLDEFLGVEEGEETQEEIELTISFDSELKQSNDDESKSIQEKIGMEN